MQPIEQGKDYDDLVKSQLPYKLLEVLGSGGSGWVEKVEDLLTGEQFARKVIRIRQRRRSNEEQTIVVFRNEIKNIRRLGSHRHIISLFATYTTKDEFGLILRPVASDKDLEQYLGIYRSAVMAAGPAFPDARIRNMTAVLEQAFGCLATGMSYMHKNRVRHRDVKLQNILIHDGRVLYTDFGYSFDSNGLSRSITDGKPGPMTARYSAPEVLAHEARDSSSDIYSLGCVFINILSALTSALTPEIQEIASFADSMDDIHQHIVHWQTSMRTASLPAIIAHMTTHEPSKRLCAVHMASKILRSAGLSCQECAMHPVIPESECAKIRTCTSGAQNTGQNYVLRTADDAVGSSEISTMASHRTCLSRKTKASTLSPNIDSLVPDVTVDHSSTLRGAVSVPVESSTNFVVHISDLTDKFTHARGQPPSTMSMAPSMTTHKDDRKTSMTYDGNEAHTIHVDSVGSCVPSSRPPTLFSAPFFAGSSPRRFSTFPIATHHYGALFLARETPDDVGPNAFLGSGQFGSLGRSHTTPAARFNNPLLTNPSMPETRLDVPTILVFHEDAFSHCIPIRMYHSCSALNTESDQHLYGMLNTANSRYNTKAESTQVKEAISMLGVGRILTNAPHTHADYYIPGHMVNATGMRAAFEEKHDLAKGSPIVEPRVPLQHTQESTTG